MGDLIHLRSSQHDGGPTCEQSAGRPDRESVCRSNLELICDGLLALCVVNLLGLIGALSFAALDAAILFTFGMLGAGVAMMAAGIVQGLRS